MKGEPAAAPVGGGSYFSIQHLASQRRRAGSLLLLALLFVPFLHIVCTKRPHLYHLLILSKTSFLVVNCQRQHLTALVEKVQVLLQYQGTKMSLH